MEIKTERLVIRNLRESDYPQFETTLNDVQKTCMGSGKAFMDWLILQYNGMDIKNSILSFGMFLNENGKLIGTVGAGKHDDLNEPEIFYSCLDEYRGNGYVTEAAKALTDWVFENYDIPYLIGTVSVDNEKSQHVLERCGYRFIDERSLLVHVTNERYVFRYYRYYPKVTP